MGGYAGVFVSEPQCCSELHQSRLRRSSHAVEVHRAYEQVPEQLLPTSEPHASKSTFEAPISYHFASRRSVETNWVSPIARMTADQAASLRQLAEAAYELDAFTPKLTQAEAHRRIAMLTAKLKLLDGPPHNL